MEDINSNGEGKTTKNKVDMKNIKSNIDVEKRVESVISKHVDDATKIIKPESTLIDDLGFDSLDSVELVMSLEEEFDIEIADEDAAKMKTVADVMFYIKSCLN